MTKKANGARPLTPPVRRTDVSLAISVALDDNHSSHLRRCRPWSRDITVTPLVFSSEVVLLQLHGAGPFRFGGCYFAAEIIGLSETVFHPLAFGLRRLSAIRHCQVTPNRLI
jgi:hypothetical protein